MPGERARRRRRSANGVFLCVGVRGILEASSWGPPRYVRHSGRYWQGHSACQSGGVPRAPDASSFSSEDKLWVPHELTREPVPCKHAPQAWFHPGLSLVVESSTMPPLVPLVFRLAFGEHLDRRGLRLDLSTSRKIRCGTEEQPRGAAGESLDGSHMAAGAKAARVLTLLQGWVRNASASRGWIMNDGRIGPVERLTRPREPRLRCRLRGRTTKELGNPGRGGGGGAACSRARYSSQGVNDGSLDICRCVSSS